MAEASKTRAGPAEPAAASQARLLRIIVEPGEVGLWHAQSPDWHEFRVTDTSFEQVMRDIPEVIAAFGEINGEPVVAIPCDVPLHWVMVSRRWLADALAKAAAGSSDEPTTKDASA